MVTESIADMVPNPQEIDELEGLLKSLFENKMFERENIELRNHHPQSTVNRKSGTDESRDLSSIQGHFGWAELGKVIIPYVIRFGEKYVSLRMVSKQLVDHYERLLINEIRKCFIIHGVPATPTESLLLNEINYIHCDSFYGDSPFIGNDPLASLKDVEELFDFFQFYSTCLAKTEISNQQRCGCIRIDSQNCVPFVKFEGKQYVPLFYFEGACHLLEERAIALKGWELAYLKIACKIQGIKKALYDNNFIQVVELEFLKKFLFPDTSYEEFWSFDNLRCHLINANTNFSTDNHEFYKDSEHEQNIINTGKHSNVSLHQAKENAVSERKGRIRARRKTITSPQMMKKVATRVNQTTYPDHCRKEARTNVTANHPLNALTSHANHNNSNNQCTPPLPNTTYLNEKESINYINCTNRPLHTNTVSNDVQKPIMRQMCTLSGIRYYQIPDTLHCSKQGSYILQWYQIENIYLNFCINSEPFTNNYLLVPIEEIVSVIGTSIHLVERAISILDIEVYLPNKEQKAVFYRNNILCTRGLLAIANLLHLLMELKFFSTLNV